MEETLVIIKPDAVQRQAVGGIISRFENKGLKIRAMRMETLKKGLLEKHYEQHRGKPFFGTLVDFMSSGPSILIILEGIDCTAVVRKMVGATNSRNAEPGTIRGDFGNSLQNNLVHASESIEAAQKEIKLFFTEKENYTLSVSEWIYSREEAKK